MSLLNNLMTATKTNEPKGSSLVLQQLFHYVIFTVLGLLGGASSVALTVGLVIIVQSALPPTQVFWPNIILLTIVAVLIGLSISWLLSRAINHILPDLFEDANKYGMQVMLIFSILTSLLQTFLFMRDL